MKKVKVGIIGAGRIGQLHAENISHHVPQAHIKSIADLYMNDDTKAWATELGIEVATNDYKEIINDPEIEAVLICSSTNTHADITIEAAKAGKHIFCEKPIDLTIEKVQEALKIVNGSNVKFQVGFNRRFDHNFKQVKDTVKSGKVGDVHIVKITSRDPAPPPIDYVKVSGGIFLDMTIHDFDMARYLSGSEVEEVYVQAAVLVDEAIGEQGDVDTAIITLKFKNGALGVIDNSRKAVYGYDQRVEVFGSKGAVAVSNDHPSTAVVSTADGITSDKPLWFFLERYKDSFVSEMNAFFNAIAHGSDTPVEGRDGLEPMYIGFAAKKSLLENRPVKIEEIKKEYH